jgi:hypothetical protein
MKTYSDTIEAELKVMKDQKGHFEKRNELFKNELSGLLQKYENR